MRLTEIAKPRLPRKPTEEALAKAESEGFDTSRLFFHGTRKRFDAFRLPKERGIDELGPGVYLTSVKWLANTWARKGGFIVIAVVRKGPIFDMARLDEVKRPRMGVKRQQVGSTETVAARKQQVLDVLTKGYIARQKELWGDADDGEGFEQYLHDSRDQNRLINACLSAAGYVGGYNRDSQIEGQIVVFKPEDVMIVARHGGQEHMSPFGD